MRKNVSTGLQYLVCSLAFSLQSAYGITGGIIDADTLVNNATVSIDNGACTGVLISPRIIATAGHCYGLDLRVNPEPVALPGLDDDNNWETPGEWYRPFWLVQKLGTGSGARFSRSRSRDPVVTIGNDKRNPLFQTATVGYSPAGFADLMLMLLETPVPATVATPVRVLTQLPGVQYPAVLTPGANGPERRNKFSRDARQFWRGKRLRLAGWGSGVRFRQVTSGVLRAFPLSSGRWSLPNKIQLSLASGVTVDPGDSGGPIYWTDPLGVRFLVGTSQQGGNQPTYFATWSIGGYDGEFKIRPNLYHWYEKAFRSGFFGPDIDRKIVRWRKLRAQLGSVINVAACANGSLYALRNDLSLWINNVADRSAWRKIKDRMPTGTQEITCGGTKIFYLTKPNHQLGQLQRSTLAPQVLGQPRSADSLSGYADESLDFARLEVLNYDKSYWVNKNNGSDSSWNKLSNCDLRPMAVSCAMRWIVDIARSQGTTFRLSDRNILSFNKFDVSNERYWYGVRDSSAVNAIPVGVVDVSAASRSQSGSTHLFLVDETSTTYIGEGQQRTYHRPRLGEARLDLCLKFGRQCGQPVADLYCMFKGYDNATRFTIDRRLSERTVIAGEGLRERRYCTGGGCDGFRSIVCKHAL